MFLYVINSKMNTIQQHIRTLRLMQCSGSGGGSGYGNDKNPIIKIAIEEILDLCHIPIFQRQQNLEKIQTIVEYQREYFHKHQHVEFLGIISLAILMENGGNEHEKIYILDGQHRLCAMKQLIREGYNSFSIYVQLVPVRTMDEMREKFRILNSHVEVPEYVLTGSMDQKKMLEQLGEYIRMRYPTYLSNSHRPKNPNIHLETFLDNIFKNDNFDQNIFERYQITHLHHLIHYMESWNFELLNRFQHSKKEYYEMITKKIKPKKNQAAAQASYFSLGFDKTDQWLSYPITNISSYQTYMIPEAFMKTIQPYVDRIISNSASAAAEAVAIIDNPMEIIDCIPESEQDIMEVDAVTAIAANAKKRKAIKKPVREALWAQYHGNSIKGTCYVCQNNGINCYNFEVGHVIAVANGGTDHISNLRPICKVCNCSMGTQNLEEYKSQYFGN